MPSPHTVHAHADSQTPRCCICGRTDPVPWDKSKGMSLVRCQGCSLLFVWPRETHQGAKNEAVYNETYFFGGHNLFPTIQSAQLKSCLQEKRVLERLHAPSRILDVGCGNGKFLRVLGPQWEKHGCDVACAAVEFVKKLDLFEVRQGLLEELDYAPQSFDVIYFRASLHHTENPRRTLEAARRLLKPTGLVAVSMSNNAAGLCGRIFKAKTRSFDFGHTHFFTPGTLRQLFSLCGLRVVHDYFPYFGTGYESPADVVSLVYQMSRLLSGREDVVSPPFYGNYVSMYAVPTASTQDPGSGRGGGENP